MTQQKPLVLLGIPVLKQKLQQESPARFVKWKIKGFSSLALQGLSGGIYPPWREEEEGAGAVYPPQA